MKTFLATAILLICATNAEAAKSQYTILEFGAKWCDSCKKMKSSWRDSRVKNELKKYHRSGYIDIDKYPNLAVQFGVDSIPTVLIVDSNGRVLKRAIGYMSADQLYQFLNNEVRAGTNGQEEVFVFPGALVIARYLVIIIAKLALLLLGG